MNNIYERLIKTKMNYQIILLIIISINYIVNSCLIAGFIYLTFKPVLFCKKRDEVGDFQACMSSEICNNKVFEFQKQRQLSLDNWAYRMNLYCDNDYYIPLINSAIFLGGIMGSIIFSRLGDTLGRRKTYLTLLAGNCFTVLACLFITNPLVMVFNIFIFGISLQSFTMIPLIIAEYFEREKFAILVSFTNLLYPITGLTLAVYFYFFNSYDVLFGTLSILSVICNILAWIYLYESPKWLISKGNMNKYREVLVNVSKINKSEILLEQMLKETEYDFDVNISTQDSQLGLGEVIKNEDDRNKLIIFSIIWLSYGFVFFGLLLNTEKIDVATNFFLNSIVFFLGEFVADLMSGYFAQTIGRVITFKVASIGGGLSFMIFGLLSDSIFKTTFLFLASLGFSAGFNLCYILTPESFSTNIRSTVLGYLNLLSRAGSLMVPGFSMLVDKNLPAILGMIAVSSGILSFHLDETINKKLNDEIEVPFLNKEETKK